MELSRDLSFKGDRTYLAGTTVFDDIIVLRGSSIRGIDFRFNHKTDRQVCYQSASPAEGQISVGTWRDDQDFFHIVERDAPITARVPFNEDDLVENFVFEPGRVALPTDVAPNSTIEAIVAGYKQLLLRSVIDHQARLAFVRLRLPAILTLPLEIRFSRRLGDFYQGDLVKDRKPAGQIFFGEWR
jgi:hypothetical protein